MDQEKETMIENPANGGRTFTQDDVNRIVGERLSKEKAKGDAALAEREQAFAEREKQLANREALLEVREALKEKGLPDELLPVLNVQDRAALNKALEALADYIKEKKSQTNRRILENTLPETAISTEETESSRLRKAMGLSGR